MHTDTDILKILSSQDIRKLEFALTEFIEPMKKRGVDIEKGNLTIKDIAEGLEGIGQHHYSSILIKKGKDLQRHYTKITVVRLCVRASVRTESIDLESLVGVLKHREAWTP